MHKLRAAQQQQQQLQPHQHRHQQQPALYPRRNSPTTICMFYLWAVSVPLSRHLPQVTHNSSDSITWGAFSTTGDGYRGDLANSLVDDNAMTMVGVVQHGTMKDNFNAGYPGFRISQIGDYANQSLAQKPNAVLLHVGTNDCIQNYELDQAPQRLGALIDQALSIVPNATVLVAQIIASTQPKIQANIEAYNAQVPGVVQQRASSGSRVMTVDMSQLLDNTTDYANTVHPNDSGYAKMASAWLQGLEQANGMSWVANSSAPDSGDVPANGTAAASAGPTLTTTTSLSLDTSLMASTASAAPSTAPSAVATATSQAAAPRLGAVPFAALCGMREYLWNVAAPTAQQPW